MFYAKKVLTLKGMVCSMHYWLLKSKTPSIVAVMIFQSGAAVCVSVSGKTVSTGGESVRAVIY